MIEVLLVRDTRDHLDEGVCKDCEGVDWRTLVVAPAWQLACVLGIDLNLFVTGFKSCEIKVICDCVLSPPVHPSVR